MKKLLYLFFAFSFLLFSCEDDADSLPDNDSDELSEIALDIIQELDEIDLSMG